MNLSFAPIAIVRARSQCVALSSLLSVSGLLASGCLHAQAKTVAEIPLDMPAPPERVVEVIDPNVPPIVSVPEEPARPEPTRPRPAPPARSDARPPVPARPDPPDVPAEATHADEPSRPPAALQTTPSQQEMEMERRIRSLMSRATTDLSRVNYQALNTDARTQYDTAKRFVSQAEEAIKARNLVFAANLADKASALAATLAGR